MGRIIWCCIPICVFLAMVCYVVPFAISSIPLIGYWGFWPVLLILGFLLIWVGRLIIAIKQYRDVPDGK